MGSWAVFTVLASLLALSHGQSFSAVATFNSRGVSGTVTFTESAANTSVIQIAVSLDGLTGNNAWHVHLLPVDQTAEPSYQCLSTFVGLHYDPFNANISSPDYSTRCTQATPEMCEVGDLAGKFGPIPVMGQKTAVDSTGLLALRGRRSIVGRSVVIHRHDDGSNFECATIRYMDETTLMVTTLQARMISPVAGTVYFRQVGARHTAIWGKLYWVNDVATTMEHNWHIHRYAPGEEHRIGTCNTTGNIGPHFDPEGAGPTDGPDYATNCTPDTPLGCEEGDLTGKHDRLSVSATPAPYATNSFFYTDTTLTLADVINRSVAIHQPNRGGPVVACSPLVISEDITLYLYDEAAVSDNLKVSQRSPFEDTIITTAIRNPLNILESALSPANGCPVDGGVYTPYPVVEAPPPGVETPDRFPLGDWDQRYNFTPSQPFNAFDVPIHSGDNSISGKTVRQIVRSDVRTCGVLLPNLGAPDRDVIIAKASFSDIIEGSIYFIQELFDAEQVGNTHVIVDVYYREQDTMTSGHNWHIHQEPTQSGMMCVDAIGGHYNPFTVSLANTDDETTPSQFSNYNTDCSERYNLRCESGDLSGKHGRLSIYPDVNGRTAVSFVDSNLYLSGDYSIIGRSVGLHDTPGPLFDCGDINRVYISSSVISVRLNAGIRRTEFAKLLVETTNVDFTDVLVMGQNISPLGFGFECVTISARALGSTQVEADQNAGTLAARTGAFICNGSLKTVAPLSLLLLIACLLLGLTF